MPWIDATTPARSGDILTETELPVVGATQAGWVGAVVTSPLQAFTQATGVAEKWLPYVPPEPEPPTGGNFIGWGISI